MATILAVDNEEKMCKLIQSSLQLDGYKVDTALSGKEALHLLGNNAYDIVITDLKMDRMDGLQLLELIKRKHPYTEVILITAYASQETALAAMKNGALDYLIKPFKMDELVLRIERILQQKRLEEENKELKDKLPYHPDDFPGIIGKSVKMKEVFRQIRQVCQSDAAVNIYGESGTGKELIAKAIHQNSDRKTYPFMAINCAALPEALLESELFGYEKGAFTGAVHNKRGIFEEADGGTIFLDEIGDMPITSQAKLLRVLQNNEIIHLGGHVRISVNFRLICATNKNLEQLITEKKFREDLYYRINIFSIHVPPLRERKEDIPELIQFFLKKYPNIGVSSKGMQKFIEYDYPGNVRELENLITRHALISSGVIGDLQLQPSPSVNREQDEFKLPENGIIIDDLEKNLILQALNKTEGNKSKAAKLLGITRRRLYSMMERFGIDPNDF